MASKNQSINNFLKIINIFDRMKLLHKSMLDLVPLSIVTILIAIFAYYGLNSLNKDFDKLLSIEAKLGTETRSARQALVNWKASVLGLVVATEQNSEAIDTQLRQVKDAGSDFNSIMFQANMIVNKNKDELMFIQAKKKDLAKVLDKFYNYHISMTSKKNINSHSYEYFKYIFLNFPEKNKKIFYVVNSNKNILTISIFGTYKKKVIYWCNTSNQKGLYLRFFGLKSWGL